jgi:uncharacterized alkaline shock family protein YloU
MYATAVDAKPVEPIQIARAVADAVERVPGVVELGSGRFSEVATYGPSEKVQGVVVSEREDGLWIEIHLLAQYSPQLNIPKLAQQARAAALQAISAGNARVDIVVDDLRFGGDGT